MDPNQQTGSMQEQVKTMGQQVAQQARDTSQDIVEKVGDTTKGAIDQQKGRAAGMVGSVADALHQTGHSLQNNDQDTIGRMMHQAADRLDQFSDDLQHKSVDEMVNDLEDFARHDPQLFLGGAVVLGLLAARFFKASGQRAGQRGAYSQYGNYGRQSMSGYSRQTPGREYSGQAGSSEYTSTYSNAGYTGSGPIEERPETFETDYTTEGDYPEQHARPSGGMPPVEGRDDLPMPPDPNNPPFSGPGRR